MSSTEIVSCRSSVIEDNSNGGEAGSTTLVLVELAPRAGHRVEYFKYVASWVKLLGDVLRPYAALPRHERNRVFFDFVPNGAATVWQVIGALKRAIRGAIEPLDETDWLLGVPADSLFRFSYSEAKAGADVAGVPSLSILFCPPEGRPRRARRGSRDTPRRMAAAGYSASQIAQAMGLSVRAVRRILERGSL